MAQQSWGAAKPLRVVRHSLLLYLLNPLMHPPALRHQRHRQARH